jgi:hypothetical protein
MDRQGLNSRRCPRLFPCLFKRRKFYVTNTQEVDLPYLEGGVPFPEDVT